MFAFEMSLEVAEEFYRRAHELNAITEEQRTHILLQMAEEGLIREVVETDMPREEFIGILSEHFNVLDLTDKRAKPGEEPKTVEN